ncbi:MAG: ATP-dependent RecD-like DNA helicase, partial [Lachnospiraceae bacterium]|nr:ATP-dependent RecD-like DNA helicase [Lachnospiraceae bacterium]
MSEQKKTVEGYVEKIVFRNAENGYTVLSLSSEEEEELTCVGTFSFINEGEYVHLTGTMTAHNVYGEQLRVESYEIKEPTDLVSMERYLGSGAIKGVGPALAARMIRHFKEDTFRIIEDEPERLTEVKGISERISREIAIQFEEKRELRSAMLFLQQYGISLNLAVKIYKQYGNRMYEIMRQNPYKLAEDISGVGFRIADEIAKKAGINSDSDFRIKAGMLHILQEASNQGHVYLPEEELYHRTADLLAIDSEKIQHHLMDMVLNKQIVIKKIEEQNCVYSSYYYYAELNCAKMLMDLNLISEYTETKFEQRIIPLQREMDMELDALQKQAVYEAAK